MISQNEKQRSMMIAAFLFRLFLAIEVVLD